EGTVRDMKPLQSPDVPDAARWFLAFHHEDWLSFCHAPNDSSLASLGGESISSMYAFASIKSGLPLAVRPKPSQRGPFRGQNDESGILGGKMPSFSRKSSSRYSA